MKKLSLLLLLIGNVYASGLETQAKSMGVAKSIALYWQERIQDEQRALEGCEVYSSQQFTDEKLKAISVKACIDNFKVKVKELRELAPGIEFNPAMLTKIAIMEYVKK